VLRHASDCTHTRGAGENAGDADDIPGIVAEERQKARVRLKIWIPSQCPSVQQAPRLHPEWVNRPSPPRLCLTSSHLHLLIVTPPGVLGALAKELTANSFFCPDPNGFGALSMFGRHGDHDLQVMPNCAASSNSDGRKAAIEEEGQEEETQAEKFRTPFCRTGISRGSMLEPSLKDGTMT